jgi:ABC-type Fe3+/spermidine/putrescine transport system ATPase subunit
MGPATSFSCNVDNRSIMTPFGAISIEDKIIKNNYQVLIRPDAFSIASKEEESIPIKIVNYKYIGALTEVEILDSNKGDNFKFLVYSNIFQEIYKKNKLSFNKDWAFVFPNN